MNRNTATATANDRNRELRPLQIDDGLLRTLRKYNVV